MIEPDHTMENTSCRLIGAEDKYSRISIPQAKRLLTQTKIRKNIFLIASWISGIFSGFCALIVIHVINAAQPIEITNATIIVAHAVSLLLNVIFVVLYLRAITSRRTGKRSEDRVPPQVRH